MEENKNMNTAAAAADEELRVTEKAVEMLRTVYDPEIRRPAVRQPISLWRMCARSW